MTAATPADIAYHVLRLEEKLDSYQRLHMEELEQIRQALHELKSQLLALADQKDVLAVTGGKISD